MTKGGGQTNFPRAATKEYPHGGPQPYDYFVRALHTSSHTYIQRPFFDCALSLTPLSFSLDSLSLSQDCSKGLSVYPQAGKVIIFYSMLPDGSMDDFSLHGGCDVLDKEATKWSANFWLWNKPYHFVDPARKRSTQELKESWL